MSKDGLISGWSIQVPENLLGGWSISEDLIKSVQEFIPRAGRILEFGSGNGTFELINLGYQLFSVEENSKFIGLHHSTYCLAEIENGWYNKERVLNFLENRDFDALLIDGPAKGDRLKMLEIGIDFEKFKTIIIDDIDREGDRDLFDTLSKGKKHKLTSTYGVIFND
jgi:hypothetical protein